MTAAVRRTAVPAVRQATAGQRIPVSQQPAGRWEQRGISRRVAVHGLPEVPVRGLPSGGSGSGTGAPPQGGNPPSHDGMYDAPAAVLPAQSDKPTAGTAKSSSTARSRPATASAQEETKRPVTAAEQVETKYSAIQQAHERPVVIAAGAPKAEKAQDVKPKQQLVSGRQGRPAAVDAVGMAQVSGGTARKPAAQPHESSGGRLRRMQANV